SPRERQSLAADFSNCESAKLLEDRRLLSAPCVRWEPPASSRGSWTSVQRKSVRSYNGLQPWDFSMPAAVNVPAMRSIRALGENSGTPRPMHQTAKRDDQFGKRITPQPGTARHSRSTSPETLRLHPHGENNPH